MFKKAIGKSKNENPFQAGQWAAREALKNAQIEGECDIVIVHANDGYENYEDLLRGIREETKNSPLVGTLAGGVITQECPDEDLKTVMVMVIKSDQIRFTPVLTENPKEDLSATGKEIAGELTKDWPEDAKFLLLYPAGFLMNLNDLFKGLESNLPEKIPFFGGTSGGTIEFKKTLQFFNDQVLSNSVISVLVSGNFDYEARITHGAVPLDISSSVTKAEKNVVHEFDSRPAFEIYSGFAESHKEILARTSVCLGTKTSEESEGYDENLVLRIPLSITKEGSLIMATEWPEGTNVFLCKRDFDIMAERAARTAEKIRKKIEMAEKEPKLVFHFECLGRAKGIVGEGKSREIIEASQKNLTKTVPWIGWYTYGEIAPIGEKNELHNWTGVFLAIY